LIEEMMGRGILLWPLGVPIPVIITVVVVLWPLTQGIGMWPQIGPPDGGAFFAARHYCNSRKRRALFCRNSGMTPEV
jgi:hypothetical protein